MNEEVNKVASENGFVLSGQDIFGRYAKIAYGNKKYGRIPGEQDYHIYKCIQRFRSNCWCDVPLTYQTENNCYNHGEMQDVVNVIHCGIDESKVIRVALKDIELLPTNTEERSFDALRILDDINDTGRMDYGDYCALHDAISSIMDGRRR